jgi:thiamine biosynthesis lipoprotein ApbE
MRSDKQISEINLKFASFAWCLDGQAHAIAEIANRAQRTRSGAFNILVGTH